MISETDLMWWCALHKCRALTEIKAVCDLGLQEMHCGHRDAYDKTTKLFAELCGEPHVSLADCQSSADMWRRLKREIVSLDAIGSDPSLIHFDLNRDSVHVDLKERFDFVTNVGTTEHVFNQANCFTVLHDLTKVGGIMAHAIPFAGFENHGFFKYSLKFFTRVALANHYDCLDAWGSVDLEDRRSKPDVSNFFSDSQRNFRDIRSDANHPIDFYKLNLSDYRSFDACIYVFLRKTEPAGFQIPVDFAD